jgi:hypothetical protein
VSGRVRPPGELAVLPVTSLVVTTEFACGSRMSTFLVWLRYRLYTRHIMSAVTGLNATWTTVSWRRRRVLNVSLWESSRSVYSLGTSRRHVETVRWAVKRADITTRSDAYTRVGEYRQLMLRERAPSLVIDRKEEMSKP